VFDPCPPRLLCTSTLIIPISICLEVILLSSRDWRSDECHANFIAGMVIVRGASTRSTVLKEIMFGVLKANSMHHSFQVRCTSDDENTLKGTPLHSERTFSETEPGFLGMHCSSQSSGAGPMIFVDGWKASQILEGEHPEEYKVLCSTRVSFAKINEDVDMRASRPSFELDYDGQLHRVSFDEQHRMRWEGGAERGGTFLHALNKAANLLYRSDLAVPHSLEEGDVVLLDTRRVLWGQVPATADNVQSTVDCSFVACDDVHSCLRVLHKTVNSIRE
jgi:alpha-ketoglutarate-dependent taurine dioxygenase